MPNHPQHLRFLIALTFGPCLIVPAALAKPLAQPAATAVPQRPIDLPLESGQLEQVTQLQGQTCAIRVHNGAHPAVKETVAAALLEVDRVLRVYSETNRTNEIHSINTNADKDEVIVNGEAHVLLQRAVDVCRRTAGAYDPTVATFDYLWNFRHQPLVRPLPQELAIRRAIAGCKFLVVKPNHAVRLMRPGMRVTLHALARGYALDRASQVLRGAGIVDFRITLGRDVYAQGRMGTRHWYATAPNARANDTPIGQLYLSSHAAVTRSDSDAFAYKTGKRYHDVIDPRTGQPAGGVAQVTIIATDPTLAAALGEAVFALGPKAGLALLAKEVNVEGFVIDTAGKIYKSKGMGDFARLDAQATVDPAAGM